MEKIYLIVSFFLSTSFGLPVELFISEYVEGSSYNKAIELYNGTGGVIDFSTHNYFLEFYCNGNTSPKLSIKLNSGIIDNNDVFVITPTNVKTELLNFVTPDFQFGTSWFNGDDAIVLRNSGNNIIDAFGQIGYDPGIEWGSGVLSSQNNTLIRAAGIEVGDLIPFDNVDFSREWNGYANNTFSNLGSHTVSYRSQIVSKQTVPEPTTLLLLVIGLISFALIRKRKNI